MNNIEKKLDALIDALGFDVEEAVDHRKYNFECALAAEYGAPFHKVMSDYMVCKLTKRDSFVPLPVNSSAWGCMVEYLSNHTADIESKTNDFNTLAPMLDFINRNCK